jgi:hypothetical protein
MVSLYSITFAVQSAAAQPTAAGACIDGVSQSNEGRQLRDGVSQEGHQGSQHERV